MARKLPAPEQWAVAEGFGVEVSTRGRVRTPERVDVQVRRIGRQFVVTLPGHKGPVAVDHLMAIAFPPPDLVVRRTPAPPAPKAAPNGKGSKK